MLIEEKHKQQLNYVDPECTFTPKINKYTMKHPQQEKTTMFVKTTQWK